MAVSPSDQIPGAIVLFNFIDFDEGIHLEPGALKLPARQNSLVDVKTVRDTFLIMDLHIDIMHNARLRKFKEKIEDLSKHDFSKYASIHLIYMSHGNANNVVYCRDGKFDVLAESNKVFQNPTLNGKPKYLIVQACKGFYDVNASYDNNRHHVEFEKPAMTWCLFSSFEGFVSKIGPTGSLFIQHLCKGIKEKWSKQTYNNIIQDFGKTYSRLEQTPYLKRYTDDFADFSYGNFRKN